MSRLRWYAVALFAVALAALWASRGIHDDKEALKYIGCAQDLLRGNADDLLGSYKAYASYVLFLVPFIALGVPWLAVVVQAVLAVFAAFALARLAERVSGSERCGTVALVIALFCYPFQEWVLALYTESFFASIAVLFLERARRPGPMRWSVFALALTLLLARPIGVLFILPTLIWRMRWPFEVPTRARPVAYAAVLALVLVAPGVARHQLGVIVEGHVICGFPERPGALERFHGTTVLDAQVALFHEPVYASGLFARRVLSLFTITRPYYSWTHDLLLLPFYALFVLALTGWWRWRAHPIIGLLAAVFLLNTALIGFTYDEWNGRFLVPLWPLVIVCAALGLEGIIDRPGLKAL
jgi:hypothetical protein